MKKEIFVASLLISTYALSDVPLAKTNIGCKIDVGGDVVFEGGTRLQNKKDRPYNVTKNNDDLGFTSNATVHLTVTHQAKNDWVYGMQAGVATNSNSASKAGKHYLDRTYLWGENDKFGKVELGSNVSSSNEMMITGDKSGSWQNYVDLKTFTSSGSAAVNDSNFLTSSKLVFKESNFETFGSHERSRKITYYTPKHNGFQLGLSFVPDIANNGDSLAMPNTADSNRQEKNGIAAGLLWSGKIDSKQKIDLALVSEYAKFARSAQDKSNNRHFYDAKVASIGGTYTYGDVAVSASYGNHWKSGIEKINAHIPNTFFYDIGVSYDMTEKTNLTASALYAEKFSNPAVVTAVGIDYKLASGIKPYTKIVYFNMKQKKNYTKISSTASGTSSISDSNFRNEGTALIFGTTVKF